MRWKVVFKAEQGPRRSWSTWDWVSHNTQPFPRSISLLRSRRTLQGLLPLTLHPPHRPLPTKDPLSLQRRAGAELPCAAVITLGSAGSSLDSWVTRSGSDVCTFCLTPTPGLTRGSLHPGSCEFQLTCILGFPSLHLAHTCFAVGTLDLDSQPAWERSKCPETGVGGGGQGEIKETPCFFFPCFPRVNGKGFGFKFGMVDPIVFENIPWSHSLTLFPFHFDTWGFVAKSWKPGAMLSTIF